MQVLKIAAAVLGLCAVVLIIAGLATDGWRESVNETDEPGIGKYKVGSLFGLTHGAFVVEKKDKVIKDRTNGKTKCKDLEDEDEKCSEISIQGGQFCSCRTSYSKQKKRLDDIKDSAAYKAFPKEDKQSIEDGLTVVQKLIDSGLVMIIFGAFGLVGLVVGAVFSGLSTKDAKWQMPGLIGWIVGLVFILLGLIVWGAMTAEGTDADQVSCSDDKGKDRVCPMGHSSILALVGFLLAVIGTVLHAIPSK